MRALALLAGLSLLWLTLASARDDDGFAARARRAAHRMVRASAVRAPAVDLAAPVTELPPFVYGKSTVRGVNIGGWLLLEPYMTPSLFNAASAKGAVDEYTLSSNLGRAAATQVLTNHWTTFMNESDFQLMASYGLNHVRIPFGYWMYPDALSAAEPYVTGQLPFLQQAVRWSAKYGLRVMLDLHGAPNSQNGFDNSGQVGEMRWHTDQQNIDRTKVVISKVVAEFAKPEYGGAVTLVELLNEPAGFKDRGIMPTYQKYLNDGYQLVRFPNGKKTPSPFIVAFHDAFIGLKQWAKFWPRAKFPNTLIDTHPYTVFSSEQLAWSDDQRVQYMCKQRGNYAKAKALYTTVAGEWSPATTDCATHLLGQTFGSRTEGTFPGSTRIGSCAGKSGRAAGFSKSYIASLRRYWEAQVRVYAGSADGWMMWSWKTEEGAAEDWSYVKGVQYGWIPTDAKTYAFPDPCQ